MVVFMNKEYSWINQLQDVWQVRANNYRFEIRGIYHQSNDWKEKNHFMAKMKGGRGGRIIAKATGKTPNEAIDNLLKSNAGATDITVGDIMGINEKQGEWWYL